MVFSSIFFLYGFLPITLVLYFSIKNILYRNIILTLVSLFFYAWGEPIYVSLMIFSAYIVYLSGIIIEKFKNKWQAKAAVIGSVVINLALLCFFKYTGFFIDNINFLFNLDIIAPAIRLPIGISFFTFQTLSYSLDVYRGDVNTQKSYMNLLLYVSLFPQLIAGPIVRYSEIAEQINHRETTLDDLSEGITRFIRGLGKKVLIANIAGSLTSQCLDVQTSSISVVMSWLGIILYTIQIYFDFSGYSDMAIGLGRIFGFSYNENFNYPYISRSITEFWRRWHISLGSFFRDYVYIPLGGNKKRQLLNLSIVWFLTGFWHGASWNFILWGLYYGVFVIIEKIFMLKILSKIPKALAHIYTMLIVIFGWVLFYFTDVSSGINYILTMLGLNGNPIFDLNTEIFLKSNFIFFIVSIIFCMPIQNVFIKYFKKKSENSLSNKFANLTPIAFNLIIFLIVTSVLVGESYNPFLYFRF